MSSGFASLGPAGAGPRPPQAAYRTAQEREEQSEYARDGEDGAQALLRGGLLGALLRALRQRDARELVYEADSQKAAYYRQHQRHNESQQRYQQTVLEALSTRHPACGVASDQEGQKQRDQEPNEGGRPSFGEALAPGGAEDGPDYAADYAALD